jgi:hypothetical protein
MNLTCLVKFSIVALYVKLFIQYKFSVRFEINEN